MFNITGNVVNNAGQIETGAGSGGSRDGIKIDIDATEEFPKQGIISNNTVSHSAGSGIYNQGGSNVTIRDNDIIESILYGIRLRGANQQRIVGNNIVDYGNVPIHYENPNANDFNSIYIMRNFIDGVNSSCVFSCMDSSTGTTTGLYILDNLVTNRNSAVYYNTVGRDVSDVTIREDSVIE